MKKALNILLCAVILCMLAVPALLNVSADNGFAFNIKGVNETIWGEDGTIVTDQTSYENCNPKWAITLVCKIESENVLKLISDPIAGQGAVPSEVKLKEGQVAVVIHSSTSDPEQADQYPNVFGKLAALDMQKGQYLVLEGIDLTNKTGSGTATVAKRKSDIKLPETSEADDPVSEDVSEEVSEEPEPVSEEVSEEPEPVSEEVSAEPEPVSEEPAESVPAAESAPAEESKPAEESTPAEESATAPASSGFPWWAWVLIGVGALALVCIIVALVRKK